MNVDALILAALRKGTEDWVSGSELSQQLGISRAAVWAHIEDLRALGYEVEATPHQGYRLVSCPDLLHADDLMARLGATRVIGRDIRVFQETTSTNDIIEKLARDGVKEGAVVFAESQTKGRGRLGRKWMSPPKKGLWFSILLRPEMRPMAATQLTVAAATALRRAIEAQTGLRPEIKWPNDILIRGRKVAGILTELTAELDRVNYLILGMGVDVNLNSSDFPADLRPVVTSLKAEAGRLISRSDLAIEILREFDGDYARITSGQFSAVADEWESHCTTIGHEVLIRVGQRQIRGQAEALGAEGALLVRTEHGRLEPIIGGDVTVEK